MRRHPDTDPDVLRYREAKADPARMQRMAAAEDERRTMESRIAAQLAEELAQAKKGGRPPMKSGTGAIRFARRAPKAKAPETPKSKPKPRVPIESVAVHGTRYAYDRAGCRCDACRAMEARRHQARRARRAA